MTYTVAVAGASGYAGGELLRILAAHPDFDVATVTAHSHAGEAVTAVQPHLRSYDDMVFRETTAEVLAGHDAVFVALPHGKSGALTADLPEETVVIDCGADHRLESTEAWDAFYGGEHAGAWTYGVPELIVPGGRQRAALKKTTRIAAPGCNASTVELSLAPGIAAGVIEGRDIVSVLSVGPSGAGKALKPHLLGAELMGTANPYAVGGTHRHVPEILQGLEWAGAEQPTLSFTPVLVPMARGILATTTARLSDGVSPRQVRETWEDAYADEPFVHVLPEGRMPRTADVLGANTALIGLAVDERASRAVVVTAVDNLAKGTAGAAVQSANIAFGLPEQTGLTVNGVAP